MKVVSTVGLRAHILVERSQTQGQLRLAKHIGDNSGQELV